MERFLCRNRQTCASIKHEKRTINVDDDDDDGIKKCLNIKYLQDSVVVDVEQCKVGC